ncbi:MAG: hypothetical protein O9326_21905, partial [Microcystis sp. LE19-338.1B]|nr:hypothetical protein [Microcystis sp. LE19-338.1B]MCZ8360071.1 hypothetical protein [Microcystis sp. LE19-388.1G]
GINLGEDSVLGFHLVGILAFSLSTQSFFFLATLVLSGFDPLVSVSQAFLPNYLEWILTNYRRNYSSDGITKAQKKLRELSSYLLIVK